MIYIYINIYILVREKYHLNILIIVSQMWTNMIRIWLLVYPILIVYDTFISIFSNLYNTNCPLTITLKTKNKNKNNLHSFCLNKQI